MNTIRNMVPPNEKLVSPIEETEKTKADSKQEKTPPSELRGEAEEEAGEKAKDEKTPEKKQADFVRSKAYNEKGEEVITDHSDPIHKTVA